MACALLWAPVRAALLQNIIGDLAHYLLLLYHVCFHPGSSLSEAVTHDLSQDCFVLRYFATMDTAKQDEIWCRCVCAGRRTSCGR